MPSTISTIPPLPFAPASPTVNEEVGRSLNTLPLRPSWNALNHPDFFRKKKIVPKLIFPLDWNLPKMAWVRPKNVVKRKDPAKTADSLLPILHYFSGGSVPKPASRPRLQQVMVRSPAQYEEMPSRHQLQIEEEDDLEEEADAHAFSFSRDKLVPIAPKQKKRSKVYHDNEDHQPHMIPRPRTQHSKTTRTVSTPTPPPPPPPVQPIPRTVSSYRPPPTRRHAPSESSRSVSSRWSSATTPLEL